MSLRFRQEGFQAGPPVAIYTNAGGFDDASRWLADSVNEGIRRVRLAKLGVDRSRLSDILADVNVERFGLVSRDRKPARFARPARRTKSPNSPFRSA